MIVSERATWPLWEYLTAADLIKLVEYQWDHYGLKLVLLNHTELESLEEIDRIMKIPTKWS